MSFYSETLKVIREFGLLDGASSVVVGVSGGADSVCLLDLLAEMRERGDIPASVHAAHLNHCLRGAESDEDERFVREVAVRLGVPVTAVKKDVRAARKDSGGALEEVARRERYAFLDSVAREVGAVAVAVGHTADDQVETVLHRLIRGAGPRGLRGMAPRRRIARGSPVRLIRPLVRSRRAEVLGRLRERGLSFREDSSNLDRGFLRNRIRHELIPLLESSYSPGFGESVLRLSRSLGDAFELIKSVGRAHVALCVSGAELDVERFANAPRAVRPLVIDAAASAAGESIPQWGAQHYDAVTELALSGRPGAQVHLPGEIAATKTAASVLFARATPPKQLQAVEVPLAVPGRTSAGAVTVTAEVLDRGRLDFDAFMMTKTRYDEAVDYDSVAGPLVLRSRRDGDVFRPLGARGRKKVGDFLTDLKAPADDRSKVLVAADGRGPVWIVGYRIDERVKITAETVRVLRLSLTGIGG